MIFRSHAIEHLLKVVARPYDHVFRTITQRDAVKACFAFMSQMTANHSDAALFLLRQVTAILGYESAVDEEICPEIAKLITVVINNSDKSLLFQ